VELSEWPNELTAGVILPIADKQCQRYFLRDREHWESAWKNWGSGINSWQMKATSGGTAGGPIAWQLPDCEQLLTHAAEDLLPAIPRRHDTW